MQLSLPYLASGIFFSAMISSWTSLSFKSNDFLGLFKKINQWSILLGNILLGGSLLIRWITQSYFPLSNLYESLVFLGWCISSLQLVLEYKTKSRLLTSLITPIIFLLTSFSSLTLPLEMQKATPLVPSLQSNWLMFHVSMMMISYSTLLIGSLFSILYLSFDFFQNSSKSSLLQTLDAWSYRIIGLGFPLLTLGIISGSVWANDAWGSYWSWDPKETWALITWLVFAVYLHSRILKGYQGKMAANLGSLGFCSIWICYLGVNFLSKGLHTYGFLNK